MLAATLVIVGVVAVLSTMDTTAPTHSTQDNGASGKKIRDTGPDWTPLREPQNRRRTRQPTAPTTTAKEKKSPTLAGRIIGPDDIPVSGALLTLSVEYSTVGLWSQEDEANQTITSDESGLFSIAPLKASERYSLRVDHSGFASQLLSGIEVSEDVTTDIEVRLEEGGSLFGRVIDEQGQPLDDVDIVVYELAPHNKSPERDSGNVTRSSTDGEYHFDHLYPGPARVVASKIGYATETQDMVPVATGSETELADFVLGKGAHIVGRTINAVDESPLGEVLVTARPVGGDNRTMVIDNYPPIESDSGGHFSYEGLAPGAYRLSFYLRGYAKAEIVHTANADAEEVIAKLEQLPSVHGSVVDGTTGKPVEVFTLTLSTNEHLALGPDDIGQTFSDEQGEFEYVDSYLPDSFYLFAQADGYPPSRSDLIHLEDGNGFVDVVIEMQPGTRIRGRVSDSIGNSIVNARVQLSPRLIGESTETSQLFMNAVSKSIKSEEQTTLSGPNGRYEFHNVPMGSYVVTAEHMDFALGKTDKTIDTSGHGEIVLPDVTLTGGAALKGLVVSGKGEPIAEARVQIVQYGDGLGSRFYNATTKADGRFEFAHLNAGHYRLNVKETVSPSSKEYKGFELIQYALSQQSSNREFAVTDGDLIELTVVQ